MLMFSFMRNTMLIGGEDTTMNMVLISFICPTIHLITVMHQSCCQWLHYYIHHHYLCPLSNTPQIHLLTHHIDLCHIALWILHTLSHIMCKIMDICIILNTIHPHLHIHIPCHSDTTIKKCTATLHPHLILHIPMVLGLA